MFLTLATKKDQQENKEEDMAVSLPLSISNILCHSTSYANCQIFPPPLTTLLISTLPATLDTNVLTSQSPLVPTAHTGSVLLDYLSLLP